MTRRDDSKHEWDDGCAPMPDGEKIHEANVMAELIRALNDLPEHEPPADLTRRIMDSVPYKYPSLKRRFWMWAKRPHSVTITPLRLAPALAVMVLILLLTPFLFRDATVVTPQAKIDRATVPVCFTLEADQAKTVYVIGSFNYWEPAGYQMQKDQKSGLWYLEVPLPQGRHEYAFLIDGKQAVPDPKAAFTKDDGFGSKNSVLLIGDEVQI